METRARTMSNAETVKVKNKGQELKVADNKVTAATETWATAMSNVEAAKVKSKGQAVRVAGKVTAATATWKRMKKAWKATNAGKVAKADKVPVTRVITKTEIRALVECSI